MSVYPVSLLPENSVTLIRGTSKSLELQVVDINNKPADLTGAKIVLSVKTAVTDAAPLFMKSSDFPSQAEIPFPRQGKARIFISPADTQNLAPKQYVFDVWVVLASGKRYAVIPPSTLDVQAGVTVLPL